MKYRSFVRVSDERQDQATQEAAIAGHVTTHGYTPSGEPYLMSGSAYRGRQVKLLQQAIDDMLSGEYDVLVCSASSRLWRGRSAAQAVVLMDEAEQQGARFDFAGEPHISTGGTPAEYMESIRLQAFQVNRRESDMKSERSKNNQALARQLGVVSGKALWGTVIKCDACGQVTTRADDGSVTRCGHKRTKHYVATDEAKRYIPQILARAIAGESTMTIAPWLQAETGNRWHETLVGRIIRHGSIYAGIGLISPSDAQAALAAYLSRARGGRTGSTHEPSLVIPRCGDCGGSANRTFGGRGERRKAYYRCRNKCGMRMVIAAEVDAAVIEAMTEDDSPHLDRIWVAGGDAADRAAKLRIEAMKAYAAGDKARFRDLDAQADELDAQPKVRPHWSERMSCGCEIYAPACDHEYVTEGRFFASLDRQQRRRYLAERWTVTVGYCKDGPPSVVLMHRNLLAGP